jgi:hypothetical protein
MAPSKLVGGLAALALGLSSASAWANNGNPCYRLGLNDGVMRLAVRGAYPLVSNNEIALGAPRQTSFLASGVMTLAGGAALLDGTVLVVKNNGAGMGLTAIPPGAASFTIECDSDQASFAPASWSCRFTIPAGTQEIKLTRIANPASVQGCNPASYLD